MAVFKCKMCGGTLELSGNETVVTCEYCDSVQTVSKKNDDVIANLFNRANNLRIKGEFDKAAEVYERIINEDNTDAEAYWGLVLCKYGIEYVEDPKTFKRIPTCHRTHYESILTDVDYQAVLSNADSVSQDVYKAQAEEIANLQKDILAIVKNEKPFDVFICFKETDENGKRTVDSALANDIYYQLTQEGLKVFYAAITLEDKLGVEYEPYIFAALNSAKVMLVVGTKPEYFEAVWVKNEWSRYLKIMKTDRSKILIPCYRDMDAYDLPDEFSHLQAQDMSKIGFVNDVVRGIRKIVKPDNSSANTVVQQKEITGGANTASLLRRAFMFLEDGDFESADEYCEKVLDIEPENAEAYLGKLMAECKAKTRNNLADCDLTFDNSTNYQKAVRFGDEALISELEGYIKHINKRNELNRLESVYKSACEILNDSHIWIGKESDIQAHEKAIQQFRSLNGWKDSEEKILLCQKKIEDIKAKAEAERLESERQVKLAKIAEEKKKKQELLFVLIALSVIVVLVVAIIISITRINASKYKNALEFAKHGDYSQAIAILHELGDYKDAVEKLEELRLIITKEQIEDAKVGDCITFGTYEQDNDTSNGEENVEWLVLDIQDGKLLVISKYALDCKRYNTSYENVTWEKCTLRSWLNNEFMNAAFTDEEKTKIPTVTVSADTNPEYDTNPGNATQDKIFLLSKVEAKKYFISDADRACKTTAYALAQGAWESDGYCLWWLRSPGERQDTASFVSNNGTMGYFGSAVVGDVSAVRPVLWINQKS